MKDEIIRLLSSSHYQSLAGYKPPFDPFDVLGVSRREMSYSRMLYWLLTDPGNDTFKKKFFEWLSKEWTSDNPGINYDDQKIEVKTEYSIGNVRFDLFVHVPSLRLAVCIEVKVRAKERENQIRDYQETLEKKYSNCHKAVVFLTPSGGEPETAGENPKALVVPLSWEKVAEFLDCPSGDSENQTFRVQCRNHIRRSILMCNEERNIVIKLLQEGDNKKTIRRIIWIMEHLPTLGDEEYRERYRKIVAKVVSAHINDLELSDLELSVWPVRGVAKELKIKVKQWNRASLPLTLMLYQYEKAAVRVFVWNEDYQKQEIQQRLHQFAEATGLNETFDQVTGWTCWRAVPDEPRDDIPETTISEKLDVYDDDFWVQVEKKLRNQLTPRILSTIREMVNKNEIAQTRE